MTDPRTHFAASTNEYAAATPAVFSHSLYTSEIAKLRAISITCGDFVKELYIAHSAVYEDISPQCIRIKRLPLKADQQGC
jgi:hypothetical protein